MDRWQGLDVDHLLHRPTIHHHAHHYVHHHKHTHQLTHQHKSPLTSPHTSIREAPCRQYGLLEIMPFAKFIIGAPIPPQKAKPSNSFKKWHPRYSTSRNWCNRLHFDCSTNPSYQDTLVYIKSFSGVSLSAGYVLFGANSNLTYSGMYCNLIQVTTRYPS